MPTGRSWTERTADALRDGRRAAEDTCSLLAFRVAGLGRGAHRRLRLATAAVVLATLGVPVLAAAVRPASYAGGNLLALVPTSAAVFLLLACVAAVAAAGGRELVPRDQAVALPVSTTAEHLGALVLAPLNVAWLLQVWMLLGSVAYALGADPGPVRLVAALVPVLLWVAVATALGQVVGWWLEGVRRGARGALVFRLLLVGLLLLGLAVVGTGRTSAVLDALPTVELLAVVLAGHAGEWGSWLAGVGVLLGGLVAAVLLGARPARWALQRPMRSELDLEGGRHRARGTPRSDLAALVRLDRSSVWRSVPLRRGAAVLAVLPGLVALAGDLAWHQATVLPGLVAAGGALLFGVNAWCLDARGVLWRESLPVSPRAVFGARTLVLAELLLGSALVTVVVVALRAGVPAPGQALAVLGCTLVVVLQVVAGSMRWSLSRPSAVDLRSARATPAPPAAMVGYSARLAWVTTLTGLVFSGLALLDLPWLTLWTTLLLLTWSGWRLERVAQRWEDAEERARVVVTVAG